MAHFNHLSDELLLEISSYLLCPVLTGSDPTVLQNMRLVSHRTKAIIESPSLYSLYLSQESLKRPDIPSLKYSEIFTKYCSQLNDITKHAQYSEDKKLVFLQNEGKKHLGKAHIIVRHSGARKLLLQGNCLEHSHAIGACHEPIAFFLLKDPEFRKAFLKYGLGWMISFISKHKSLILFVLEKDTALLEVIFNRNGAIDHILMLLSTHEEMFIKFFEDIALKARFLERMNSMHAAFLASEADDTMFETETERFESSESEVDDTISEFSETADSELKAIEFLDATFEDNPAHRALCKIGCNYAIFDVISAQTYWYTQSSEKLIQHIIDRLGTRQLIFEEEKTTDNTSVHSRLRELLKEDRLTVEERLFYIKEIGLKCRSIAHFIIETSVFRKVYLQKKRYIQWIAELAEEHESVASAIFEKYTVLCNALLNNCHSAILRVVIKNERAFVKFSENKILKQYLLRASETENTDVRSNIWRVGTQWNVCFRFSTEIDWWSADLSQLIAHVATRLQTRQAILEQAKLEGLESVYPFFRETLLELDDDALEANLYYYLFGIGVSLDAIARFLLKALLARKIFVKVFLKKQEFVKHIVSLALTHQSIALLIFKESPAISNAIMGQVSAENGILKVVAKNEDVFLAFFENIDLKQKFLALDAVKDHRANYDLCKIGYQYRVFHRGHKKENWQSTEPLVLVDQIVEGILKRRKNKASESQNNEEASSATHPSYRHCA